MKRARHAAFECGIVSPLASRGLQVLAEHFQRTSFWYSSSVALSHLLGSGRNRALLAFFISQNWKSDTSDSRSVAALGVSSIHCKSY